MRVNMIVELIRLAISHWSVNVIYTILSISCIVMILMTCKKGRFNSRILYLLEIVSVFSVILMICSDSYELSRHFVISEGVSPAPGSDNGFYFFCYSMAVRFIYWPIWLVSYLYSKIRGGMPIKGGDPIHERKRKGASL